MHRSPRRPGHFFCGGPGEHSKQLEDYHRQTTTMTEECKGRDHRGLPAPAPPPHAPAAEEGEDDDPQPLAREEEAGVFAFQEQGPAGEGFVWTPTETYEEGNREALREWEAQTAHDADGDDDAADDADADAQQQQEEEGDDFFAEFFKDSDEAVEGAQDTLQVSREEADFLLDESIFYCKNVSLFFSFSCFCCCLHTLQTVRSRATKKGRVRVLSLFRKRASLARCFVFVDKGRYALPLHRPMLAVRSLSARSARMNDHGGRGGGLMGAGH